MALGGDLGFFICQVGMPAVSLLWYCLEGQIRGCRQRAPFDIQYTYRTLVHVAFGSYAVTLRIFSFPQIFSLKHSNNTTFENLRSKASGPTR